MGRVAAPRRGVPSRFVVAAVCTAILLLAAAFHLYRGFPSQALLFAGAGFIVALDAAAVLPMPLSPRTAVPGRRVSMVLSIVGAAVLTVLPLHGALEGVLVAAIGIVVFAGSWSAPEAVPAAFSAAYRRTALWWTGVALVLCLTELAADLLAAVSGRDVDFPTMSDLLQPVMESPWWRTLLVLFWLLAGCALLRWTGRVCAGAPGRAVGDRRPR